VAKSRTEFVDTDYDMPRAGLAEQVAAIIAEVLGVDRIGRRDRLHDFGVTSLQAVRICVRIEKTLGVKIQPLALLDSEDLDSLVAENDLGQGLGRRMVYDTVHLAVSARASERPEAVALVHGENTVSYRVLDAAADAYADLLAGHGVRTGQIVPIMLPRSPRLVAVQLAVLKCGAAYATLDRAWPGPRLRAISDQIKARLAVSLDGWPCPEGVQTLPVGEDDLTRMASRGVTFAPAPVSGDNPATVFFTSGTTGLPRGIVVSHRAVTRLFHPDGLTGFGPGHATPQAAALAWDMYALEVWGQLTAGGSVVFPECDFLMPSALQELISTAKVDTAWLTTTLFNLFVDEDPECFSGLGRLYVGGEKLSPAHVRTFLRYHPSVSLYNGYGPAENCMLTTTHLIEVGDCGLDDGIPVGVAVPRTSVLVLRGPNRRCEPNELGEICAAGDGLAIGYLDEPELTAEKFPTISVNGVSTRICRTGDMGYFDELGVLHYRGRGDRQVKITGHRIELTEIEAVARRLRAVRECVAVPVVDDNGHVTHIALCYIAEPATSENQPHSAGEQDVRTALTGILPSYLVPRVIRMFDRFPMTQNGKVDVEMLGAMAMSPRA
jgi:D-alanine--poly(phosphoribitol) ligase subunit 1